MDELTSVGDKHERHLHRVNRELTERIAELVLEVERQSRASERYRNDLQTLAYAVSHDLDEPLRMVTSFMELLVEEYREQLPDDARVYVDFARDGAVRAKAQIRALLAYSRAGSPRSGPLTVVDCGALVDDVVDRLSGTIEGCGATVQRGSLPTVLGDRARLGTCFTHLLENALLFRSDQPVRIDISAAYHADRSVDVPGESASDPVDDPARHTPGEWHIAVRDNGIGFDMKHAQRIFQVFQRLHARDAYPGQGMGLAVCRRILDTWGEGWPDDASPDPSSRPLPGRNGRIWAESSPGEGSTFYVALPAHAAERHSPGDSSPPDVEPDSSDPSIDPRPC